MKKILLLSLVLVFCMASGAGAGLVTISFDEEGISSGTHYTNPHSPDPRPLGDKITNQYAAKGVNWTVNPINSGVVANVITSGYEFGYADKPGYPSEVFADKNGNVDGHIMWYNGGFADGWIQFDHPVNSVAFDYRRPKAAGAINVQFYDYDDNGNWTKIYDSGRVTADSTWRPFSQTGNNIDAVYMSGYDPNTQSYNKFVMDNFQVNMVPIPAAIWLLGSGLAGLGFIKRRKSI
ncbi:MAG: VPLPA-CTERM sorting domain-containing protein [Proteobacteria bacterium]|nr:VPLPA-CTERM sorting domain-containing protein [Pseudomonadota bacterium]